MLLKGGRHLFEDFLIYLQGSFNSLLMRSEIPVKPVTALLPIFRELGNTPAMMHNAMLLILTQPDQFLFLILVSSLVKFTNEK